MIAVTVPIRTIGEANAHTHWRLRQRRAKDQRNTVALHLLRASARAQQEALRAAVHDGGVVVTITRIAPRELDSDNNVGAAKHVRDQVAEWLAVDDRSKSVEWRYAQERAPAKTYAVRIEIVAAQEVRKSA